MAGLAFAATALWYVAALLSPSQRWPTVIRCVAWIQLVFQLCLSAFVSDAFGIAALAILPPVITVTGLYARLFRVMHDKRLLIGLAGFVLAMISGLVIVFEYSAHPQWGTTNAIYHIFQFVAFWLVFASISALSRQPW
jgi:hypothetical protein